MRFITKQSPENGIQQINSELSSLSFNPTITQGVIKKPDVPISPMASTMNYSFERVVPQEQPPYYAPSSMPIPDSHPQNKYQMAPAENFTPSPFINEKYTFSPNLNTSVSSVGRSSPLGSFLPPPPKLDTFADASQCTGRFDNTDNGLFLFENDDQPTSPLASTRRNCSNRVHNEDMNRARSLSLPANHLRQCSFGTMSTPPAPSGQILYEDKPSSWMEGSGLMSSPSNFDRFNSRPPRHCGSSDTQTLISPRVEMRNTASDGNFHNFPSVVPMFNPMSPVAVANNHRHSQSSISLPLPGVDHPNDRNSFESIDPL